MITYSNGGEYVFFSTESGIDTHGGAHKSSPEVSSKAYALTCLLRSLKIIDSIPAYQTYTVPLAGYYNISYSTRGAGDFSHTYSTVQLCKAGEKIPVHFTKNVSIVKVS